MLRGKTANYQNQLKLLKIIMDKPVIWQFWLQRPTSEGWVSTVCLVKASGKQRMGLTFCDAAQPDVFFGWCFSSPSTSTSAPFLPTLWLFLALTTLRLSNLFCFLTIIDDLYQLWLLPPVSFLSSCIISSIEFLIDLHISVYSQPRYYLQKGCIGSETETETETRVHVSLFRVLCLGLSSSFR